MSVAECFKDRTDVQCLHRWQKVLNPELVKGPWSKEVITFKLMLYSESSLLGHYTFPFIDSLFDLIESGGWNNY